MAQSVTVCCVMVLLTAGCLVNASRYLPTKRSWSPAGNEEMMAGAYRVEELGRRGVPVSYVNYPMIGGDMDLVNMDDYPPTALTDIPTVYAARGLPSRLQPVSADYPPPRRFILR
ncbi:uncharacterized protein LOC129595477 [Paramacrobiotus metropolitanus]|uniref:uncharacterized protein LOC129595477 n=1 Tax=Paramacrobiotus metropolitanus TaxID=2943436 RepID=UPI0024464739|nr:uncharacterized protein LOC129595477 [Paramacrobiotus metropolitanus]